MNSYMQDTSFHQALFSEPKLPVYAILDGASVPDIINQLDYYQAEYICLFQQDITPNLAAVAPYLVALPFDGAVTQWLLSNAGKHQGIFATSKASMQDLSQHFGGLLMGYNANNKQVYIRYYDPRLLGAFLATITEEDRHEFFGPVLKLYAEKKKGDQLECFLAQMQI